MEVVIDSNVLFRTIISSGYILDIIFNPSLFLLAPKRIKFAHSEEYLAYIPKAKELLKAHTKDEDFVALSLAKNCKFWTYESLMFTLGIAISTKELSAALREEQL